MIELPGGFSIVYQGPIQPRRCMAWGCGRDLTKVATFVTTASGYTYCCRCPTDTTADKPKSIAVAEPEDEVGAPNV